MIQQGKLKSVTLTRQPWKISNPILDDDNVMYVFVEQYRHVSGVRKGTSVLPVARPGRTPYYGIKNHNRRPQLNNDHKMRISLRQNISVNVVNLGQLDQMVWETERSPVLRTSLPTRQTSSSRHQHTEFLVSPAQAKGDAQARPQTTLL